MLSLSMLLVVLHPHHCACAVLVDVSLAFSPFHCQWSSLNLSKVLAKLRGEMVVGILATEYIHLTISTVQLHAVEL
jgi:hypothetical protein